MRLLAAITLWCVCIAAHAERVILIPLDNRPAAGQFAQMIGAMADVQVVMLSLIHI